MSGKLTLHSSRITLTITIIKITHYGRQWPLMLTCPNTSYVGLYIILLYVCTIMPKGVYTPKETYPACNTFLDLWSGQKPWWNWYLTPLVNFGKVRRAQLAKSTLFTSTLRPLESFKVCSDAKKSVGGAESNGKLPHPFIPSKIATLVPEFAVEDLHLDRTATLIPAFAAKDLPLGRTLMIF